MKKLMITIICLSSLAFANFTRVSENIVLDNNTNLQWQDDKVNPEMSWNDSISYCEEMVLDSYDDWRLPNRRELVSIIDLSKYNPATDDIFNNIVSDYYWSSTKENYHYWIIDFKDGNIYVNKSWKSIYAQYRTYFLKEEDMTYSRCVRGGI